MAANHFQGNERLFKVVALYSAVVVSVYALPAGFKIDTFKAGEKVALTWEMKGTAKAVDTMLPA